MKHRHRSWMAFAILGPLALATLAQRAGAQLDCDERLAGPPLRAQPAAFGSEPIAFDPDPPLPLCTFFEEATLLGSAVSNTAWFGECVALAGTTAVVGAPGWQQAYVFEDEGGGSWAERMALSGGCSYGEAVGTNGISALIGDPFREPTFCAGSGVAEELGRTGGIWSSLFTRSLPGSSYAGYGYAIAMRDDAMLVGALGSTPCPLQGGPPLVAAYRWEDSAWSSAELFAAEATIRGDRFGAAVGLRTLGDLAVVGAPTADNGNKLDQGRAYVFADDGSRWTEVQTLDPSDGEAGDAFGTAVAIEGNLLAVGAPLSNRSGTDSGAVYLFRFDGNLWVEQQIIVGNTAGERFGTSVAMEGPLLAVGAPYSETAYVYRNQESVFRLAHKCQATTQGATGFGMSVALSGKRCLVGAPWSNLAAPSAGAAFLFTVRDLALTANRAQVSPGESVTLKVCGGLPGRTVVIGRRASGAPLVGERGVLGTVPLVSGTFDAEGAFALTLEVPLGAAGGTVTLQAFGPNQPGQRVASNSLILGF